MLPQIPTTNDPRAETTRYILQNGAKICMVIGLKSAEQSSPASSPIRRGLMAGFPVIDDSRARLPIPQSLPPYHSPSTNTRFVRRRIHLHYSGVLQPCIPLPAAAHFRRPTCQHPCANKSRWDAASPFHLADLPADQFNGVDSFFSDGDYPAEKGSTASPCTLNHRRTVFPKPDVRQKFPLSAPRARTAHRTSRRKDRHRRSLFLTYCLFLL